MRFLQVKSPLENSSSYN